MTSVGRRWSLRSLHSSEISPATSRELLECCVLRLERQKQTLNDMLAWIQTNQPDPIRSEKRVHKLAYIHKDTQRVAERLLSNQPIWERFSKADIHLINATFLELRARHANTIETIVNNITDARTRVEHCCDIHNSSVEYLQRRQGIHLLCDQHDERYKRQASIISDDVPVETVVQDAVTEAQNVVDAHLQTYSEVSISGAATFYMIRPWMRHTFFELFKNGMASSVKRLRKDTSSIEAVPPPIQCIISNDEESVTIDVVDRGVGFPDDVAIRHAFLLGHSSPSHKRYDRLDIQQSYAAVRSPLSSLGVGLAMGRMETSHFGGSLTVFNNSDQGCTARLCIPKDFDILERIPGEDVSQKREDSSQPSETR